VVYLTFPPIAAPRQAWKLLPFVAFAFPSLQLLSRHLTANSEEFRISSSSSACGNRLELQPFAPCPSPFSSWALLAFRIPSPRAMAPKEDMLPPGWEDPDRYVDRLLPVHLSQSPVHHHTTPHLHPPFDLHLHDHRALWNPIDPPPSPRPLGAI
jgi:hypothetical protein